MITLIPIFIGVGLNSSFDLKFSPTGTSWALLGVGTTAVYQILVGQKQKELGLDSMQLLSYQAPMSSGLFHKVRQKQITPKSKSYKFTDIK
jgi:solute carrier family 35 protein E3